MGENGFRKCFSINASVWLRMENTFFGNAFQFDRVLCVNHFCFYFTFKSHFLENTETERERERKSESEIALARKERERERESPSPVTRSPRRHWRTPSSSLMITRTRSHRSHRSQHRAVRSCLRSRLHSILPLRDLTFDPLISLYVILISV